MNKNKQNLKNTIVEKDVKDRILKILGEYLSYINIEVPKNIDDYLDKLIITIDDLIDMLAHTAIKEIIRNMYFNKSNASFKNFIDNLIASNETEKSKINTDN